jgi:hypothetical protein
MIDEYFSKSMGRGTLVTSLPTNSPTNYWKWTTWEQPNFSWRIIFDYTPNDYNEILQGKQLPVIVNWSGLFSKIREVCAKQIFDAVWIAYFETKADAAKVQLFFPEYITFRGKILNNN